jgi:hypothetical protein
MILQHDTPNPNALHELVIASKIPSLGPSPVFPLPGVLPSVGHQHVNPPLCRAPKQRSVPKRRRAPQAHKHTNVPTLSDEPHPQDHDKSAAILYLDRLGSISR